MRERTEFSPITESDDFIAEAIKSADVPSLILATIHITGDTSILDGPIRPHQKPGMLGDGDGLTEDQREVLRGRALEVLKSYRDQGCPPASDLPADILRRMGDFLGGGAIPELHLPMLLENAQLELDARAVSPKKLRVKPGFRVLIVGAGMSGMLTAIKLDQLGIAYTVIEKNDDLGGTWYSNSYPGCRVDIPSHFYSYSFEAGYDWPQFFSQRDSLHGYFKSVAEKYDLRRKIQFNSEVVEARWSERDSLWTVQVRRADGTVEEMKANAFVCAVGTLSRPKFPDIPGRDSFKGQSSHTCGYDRGMDVEGKRVAVIGTAATAAQAIPELAETAGKLSVFQRTAHWIFPRPNYQDTVSDDAKWLFTHVPYYANWFRFAIFSRVADGVRTVARIDPEWADQSRSCSQINDEIRQKLTHFIEEQLSEKPELIARLTPNYPPFSDRIIPNTGSFLRAFTKDNVELVSDAIASIDEGGITDATGRRHEVDVIVYATGFYASQYLGPMKVIGAKGRVMDEFWRKEPRAHLGITVPGFPNMFMIWGPGTSSGNMIFIAECQVRYILGAIEALASTDVAALECREDVYADYVERSKTEISHLACSSASVATWWKGETGHVVAYMPFDVGDYWHWTRSIDLADFVIHREPVDA